MIVENLDVIEHVCTSLLTGRISFTPYAFSFEELEEALDKYGLPEIMNTDQGSQFTGADWTTMLTEARVRVSMDDRGRYLDNIFIERLWRSLKREAIYLTERQDGFQAQRVTEDWVSFYNTERPHSALEHQTPVEAYWANEHKKHAA